MDYSVIIASIKVNTQQRSQQATRKSVTFRSEKIASLIGFVELPIFNLVGSN